MNVVSLFCGAGGMDLGFIKAGHKIVWANDNDVDSCNTYEFNIGHKVVCKDIKQVKSNEIPDCDIVIGGFPCQGFSIANKYRSLEDNRNSLYLELLRVIKDKKPKYFIAENVPGICSLGGYATKEDKLNHKGIIFSQILKELESANNIGYTVNFKILNSADFGVPQIRRRVIIFGVRKDINQELEYPKPVYFKNSITNKWLTVKEALANLPENPSNKIPNHIGTNHKVKINGHIGNRKTEWNKPSPTIVGRGGGTGGPVIIPHPNLKRRMTVRETARLQTFPDNFIFKGSITSQYRQIGNAVPVEMAYYIAKQLPIK